jgi:hypothetical protein
MNLVKYRSYIFFTTIIVVIYAARAQICGPEDPANRSDSFYNNEGFVFPYNANPFNVSDNQQHSWLLQFTSSNFYAILVLLGKESGFSSEPC